MKNISAVDDKIMFLLTQNAWNHIEQPQTDSTDQTIITFQIIYVSLLSHSATGPVETVQVNSSNEIIRNFK